MLSVVNVFGFGQLLPPITGAHFFVEKDTQIMPARFVYVRVFFECFTDNTFYLWWNPIEGQSSMLNYFSCWYKYIKLLSNKTIRNSVTYHLKHFLKLYFIFNQSFLFLLLLVKICVVYTHITDYIKNTVFLFCTLSSSRILSVNSNNCKWIFFRVVSNPDWQLLRRTFHLFWT